MVGWILFAANMKSNESFILCLFFAVSVYSISLFDSSIKGIETLGESKTKDPTLKRRQHLLSTLDFVSLAEEAAQQTGGDPFMDQLEDGPIETNGEGTGNNSIEPEVQNSEDGWEEIEQKLREVYESGTKVIKSITESFEKDCQSLKELSLSEKSKDEDYASHFYALQKSVSFNVLQLLKLDPSFWVLLDEIAKIIGKDDTSFMSEKSKALLDEIYHYQDIIQAKIDESASVDQKNYSSEKAPASTE